MVGLYGIIDPPRPEAIDAVARCRGAGIRVKMITGAELERMDDAELARAAALKRSDVGVAMGVKGTEATTGSADIDLADDNFSSIAHAVREGRAISDNLRRTIIYMLPTNGSEALVMFAALIANLVLPLTPRQILWGNMVCAVTLSIALAFEDPEPDVMERSPRSP